MKKSLFLLPLFAALTLCGCGDNGGKDDPGKKDDPTGGDDVVLDFTDTSWKDEKITPYVSDNTTLLTFDYDGMTYNDKGCYAAAYGENYYLMMKNKWVDEKVAEGDEFAFIGNANSYGKAIKSIDVEISVQTGAVDFYVAFGDSAFETAPTSGTKKSAASSTAASFTATNKGDSEYFAISATKAVGQYPKNGGVAKITIHF